MAKVEKCASFPMADPHHLRGLNELLKQALQFLVAAGNRDGLRGAVRRGARRKADWARHPGALSRPDHRAQRVVPGVVNAWSRKMHPSLIVRHRHAATLLASACLALAATAAAAPPAQPLPLADQLHARAEHAFQQGRFPEAYGRFVALADAGHAPAARRALWMCEHGLAHFGRDWDCAPHQVADWAAKAGVAAPQPPAPDTRLPQQPAAHGRRR